jgi:hypothetical protein
VRAERGSPRLSLEDWRDIVIIVAGSLLILLFLAALIFTVALGFASRSTLGAARNVIDTGVKPLVENANQTVVTVRGTTTFVSETAVTPIIRIYGVVAGTRKALSVLTGFVAGREKKV